MDLFVVRTVEQISLCLPPQKRAGHQQLNFGHAVQTSMASLGLASLLKTTMSRSMLQLHMIDLFVSRAYRQKATSSLA
jgi:hypothetical protein